MLVGKFIIYNLDKWICMGILKGSIFAEFSLNYGVIFIRFQILLKAVKREIMYNTLLIFRGASRPSSASTYDCVSIYLYKYDCVSIYVYKYDCVCIYLYKYDCVSIYLSIQIWLCIYLSIQIWLCIYLSIQIWLCIYDTNFCNFNLP